MASSNRSLVIVSIFVGDRVFGNDGFGFLHEDSTSDYNYNAFLEQIPCLNTEKISTDMCDHC